MANFITVPIIVNLVQESALVLQPYGALMCEDLRGSFGNKECSQFDASKLKCKIIILCKSKKSGSRVVGTNGVVLQTRTKGSRILPRGYQVPNHDEANEVLFLTAGSKIQEHKRSLSVDQMCTAFYTPLQNKQALTFRFSASQGTHYHFIGVFTKRFVKKNYSEETKFNFHFFQKGNELTLDIGSKKFPRLYRTGNATEHFLSLLVVPANVGALPFLHLDSDPPTQEFFYDILADTIEINVQCIYSYNSAFGVKSYCHYNKILDNMLDLSSLQKLLVVPDTHVKN